MKITSFSVKRPVFVSMCVMIVLVLGTIALSRLPIDLMPDISYPMLSVSTTYENASPQEVEEQITRPVERAVSAVAGVEEVSSASVEGSSSVRIKFAHGTNIDEATNDVRDRLDRVIPRLPEEADRPLIRKYDLSNFPVMILGASAKLDPVQMRRVVDDQIKYRFERVPGVAYIEVRGGREREVHIDLNIYKLISSGIALDTIISRIEEGNLNLSAGSVEKGDMDITIRTPGEYTELRQLENTVIATNGENKTLVSDIGTVRDSWQKVRQIFPADGIPGVRMYVYKQSGRNTVEVAEGIVGELEKIKNEFPQLKVFPIIDTSKYIKRSIRNVSIAALAGAFLAILVLLFFLRDIRSTIIISTAIPIAIIATFGLIYFCGLTINIMTLGGLALGVGMLVDNSIVVLENIYRLRENGMGHERAAVQGAEEVTSAIIASTLTTIAVFLPAVFIRGISGIMFRQLALVISFSLFCSLVTALTLVPMMCSYMMPVRSLRPGRNETIVQKIFRLSEKMFISVENEYRLLLDWALNRRWLVVIIILLVLLACLPLVWKIGAEFMPTTDESEVRVDIEMEVGTRFDRVHDKYRMVEKIVRDNVPEAESISGSVGGGGWRRSGGHTANMRIPLVPRGQRKRSSEEIANTLRRQLKGIPGAKIRTRPGRGLFFMRMGSSDSGKIEIEIRGYDLKTGDELARQVAAAMKQTKGVTDIRVSRDPGAPEQIVRINRERAYDMKLTVSKIANALQTAISGATAGKFREGGNQYDIVVKVENADKMELEDILDVTILNSDGEPVILSNVVSTEQRSGPVRIERRNQERVITISGELDGRDMRTVLNELNEKFQQIPVKQGFAITFTGDYEEQQKAFRELLVSLLLAVVLVYMVMACQYESLLDPLVVMFSVPFAGIGVILILFLTGTTFNIQSYIGCIMLGGIVVNNAIVLVDQIRLLRREEGMAMRKAVEEAGRRRLRPIMMTALTTVLGLLPLALSLGDGADAQAPLARAVIGGLSSSTLITLVFIPVIYTVFRGRIWNSEKDGRRNE